MLVAQPCGNRGNFSRQGGAKGKKKRTTGLAAKIFPQRLLKYVFFSEYILKS